MKLYDAVKIINLHRGGKNLDGLIGYIYSTPEEPSPVDPVLPKRYGVSFDYNITGEGPQGIRPENIEYYGDFEDFTRWSLASSIVGRPIPPVNEPNRGMRIYGEHLLKLANEIWNPYDHIHRDWKVIKLHEFLGSKYCMRIKTPWTEN